MDKKIETIEKDKLSRDETKSGKGGIGKGRRGMGAEPGRVTVRESFGVIFRVGDRVGGKGK